MMTADLVDQFAAFQTAQALSPNTIARRRIALNGFARHIAPRGYGDATLTDVEAWIGTKRAAATRSVYQSDLIAFYKWAVKRDLLDTNPAAGVERVRRSKGLPKPLEPSDVPVVLGRGSPRMRWMVGLALYAGLRCAEIAGLRGEDVWRDGDNPVIVVRNGKGGKDRQVPIAVELAAILAKAPRRGPLFPGRDGAPVDPASVSRRLRRFLARAGVDATGHQLRHTFATTFAQRSHGDVLLLGQLLGHTSTSTTMGYVRLASGRGRDVIDGLYGTEMPAP